jgi:NAD+ synthase (glutamine-hydrolysing)
VPPTTYGALAGATVLVNLSASNITIGKSGYRRMLCESHSGRTISAYLYTAAGAAESTTDMAWDGQALICENGDLLSESIRFSDEEQLIFADLDLDRLLADRMAISSFGDTVGDERERLRAIRRIAFELGGGGREGSVPLRRRVERFPYVPADPGTRDARCREVFDIQVSGLETRLRATGIERAHAGADEGEIEIGGHEVVPCSGADARAARRVGFHPGRGTDARSIRVYGSCGESRIASVRPRSTTWPRCMTIASSVIWRTTARSWLIRM